MSRFLAIDIEATGLLVASAQLRGSSLTLEKVLALPERGATLTLSSAETLGLQLRELLAQAGIKPAPVLLNIGRDRVILKEVLHPPTAPSEEPLVVRFQAVKELSEAPDDMVMDYLPLGVGSPEGEKRALALFIRKEYFTAAKLMCDTAQLKLAAITPRPFALGSSLRRAIVTGQVPPPEDPLGAVGSVTLTDTGGEFVVIRESTILFTRPISGQAVRNDATLVAELKRNLTVYDTQHPNQPLQSLCIPEGHGSGGASWANFLREELPINVYGYDPLAGSPLSESVPPQTHSLLASPLGLLSLKAESASLPINFVSPRQPRTERTHVSPRLLLAAVAAVLIVGLAITLAIIELNKADELVTMRQAQLEEIESQIRRLEPDMKRLEAADEFNKREVVWLDELYELATRVPDVDKVSVVEIDSAALPPPKKEANRPTGNTTLANRAGATTTARTGPGLPAAPKKELPVASMRIVVRTDDPVFPQKISDDFSNDKFYVGVSKSKPTSQGDGRGDPSYTINTQILHRGPDKYTRHLKATMPKLPNTPPAAEEPDEGFGGGFGGGFGEFNP